LRPLCLFRLDSIRYDPLLRSTLLTSALLSGAAAALILAAIALGTGIRTELVIGFARRVGPGAGDVVFHHRPARRMAA
jgi:hypothetical protein